MYKFDPLTDKAGTSDWINSTIDRIDSRKASFDEARDLTLLIIELSLELCPQSIPADSIEEVTLSCKEIGEASSFVKAVSDVLQEPFPSLYQTLDRHGQLLNAASVTLVNSFAGSIPSQEMPRKTYIIKNPLTGHIKIGMSATPWDRIRTIGMNSGVELEVLAMIEGDCESSLHDRFASKRTHGEWFADRDGAIEEFAKSL